MANNTRFEPHSIAIHVVLPLRNIQAWPLKSSQVFYELGYRLSNGAKQFKTLNLRKSSRAD